MNPATSVTSVPFRIERLGVIMTPNLENPFEAEGVLNPATAWGPDGELYLFPRLVAAGNVSRIGRARVVVENGVPVGVEPAEVVLAPDRGWERGTGHGGVEDPRITHLPSLGLHVMVYVAFGPLGPRPAIAISRDTVRWDRLGPVQFAYADALDTDLNLFPNKDVTFFPEPVPGPDGRPAYALLHRPMWEMDFTRPAEKPPVPAGTVDERASIWISYVDVEEAARDPRALTRPSGHRFVAGPAFDWEAVKVGAGPHPVRVPEGWLLIHHGVTGEVDNSSFEPQQNVSYAAGALLLAADDPAQVIARTPEPLLVPTTTQETQGTVNNVVFPTAIEQIDGQAFVFYGMADAKIGVARLTRTDLG
ncbi:MAG: glycoside hydrolase family 130 protein [Cellulomonadaceae bacterium]